MIYRLSTCKIRLKGECMEKKRISIGILALIGLVTTIKLAIIYYNANFNPYALSSFCSVNDFIDCDGVAQTSESQFLGIPLAYWGLFLYAFIFLMLFVDKLKNIKFLKFLEVFKNPFSYIAALGIISFSISMLLLVISLFEIKKLCVLCAATYILNLLIGIVALKGIRFLQVFKDSVKDLFDGLQIRAYGIAFVVVMFIAAGVLVYTSTTYVFAPQAKNAKEFKQYVNAKHNKYAVSGNLLGKEDAEIIIYSYTDYKCPMCRAYNIMIHKLAKEMKNVKVIHKNYPLDTACNKYLRSEFHVGSCMMAKYAIAAEKQGKFWDMNNLLFDNKPNNDEEVLELAKKLDLNIEKLKEDANSLETLRQIQKDIDEGHEIGVIGTPSTYVNNTLTLGIKPYKELKEWVENAK